MRQGRCRDQMFGAPDRQRAQIAEAPRCPGARDARRPRCPGPRDARAPDMPAAEMPRAMVYGLRVVGLSGRPSAGASDGEPGVEGEERQRVRGQADRSADGACPMAHL
jgi:hypothetical protein